MKAKNKRFKKVYETISQVERDLLSKIGDLDAKMWAIKNPPKFNVGDRVRIYNDGKRWRGLIVKAYISEPHSYFREWKYEVCIIKIGKILVGPERFVK